jgi:16S rRNA (adenine1518-N6/adenine1519-N6)-dimethyltransferase
MDPRFKPIRILKSACYISGEKPGLIPDQKFTLIHGTILYPEKTLNFQLMIRPKKHLGQHFLKDKNIAKKIVDSLTFHNGYRNVLEIGPGKGILTQFLFQNKNINTWAMDIDPESTDLLRMLYPEHINRIIQGDFLQLDPVSLLGDQYGIIGNFPYNISSQILFRVLETRDHVQEVVGMFQKEVAERLTAKEGNKTYGKLTVLLNAYYNLKYLFTVNPGAFFPVPKVRSAVIRLERNDTVKLRCNEELFFRVVLQGFQNRRKMLRNALKILNLPSHVMDHPFMQKRAEQLSVEDFIELSFLAERAS